MQPFPHKTRATCLTHSPTHQTRAPLPNAPYGDPLFLCPRHADVVRRNRLVIFVIRECVSSYTTALLIPDERKETLRGAILKICLPITPIANTPAIIRVDSAHGFKSLLSHHILIEIGNPKNPKQQPHRWKSRPRNRERTLQGRPYRSTGLFSLARHCLLHPQQ